MLRSFPSQTYVRIAALSVVLIGIIGISGWYFDLPLLRFTLHPDSAPMQPNTAICFIASGVALWLYARRRVMQGRWSGLIVLVIALLTLGDYATEHDFGIDRLFVSATQHSQYVEHMSPVTLLNFLMMGMLFFTDAQKPLWMIRSVLVIVGLSAAIALLGFLYGVSSLYDFLFFRRVALLSAIAFLLLSAGFFALHPKRLIPIPIFHNPVPLRILLVLCISVPVILGWGFQG